MLNEVVEAPEAESTLPDPAPSAVEPPADAPSASLVEADLLVEDISIDGMCGVY